MISRYILTKLGDLRIGRDILTCPSMNQASKMQKPTIPNSTHLSGDHTGLLNALLFQTPCPQFVKQPFCQIFEISSLKVLQLEFRGGCCSREHAELFATVVYESSTFSTCHSLCDHGNHWNYREGNNAGADFPVSELSECFNEVKQYCSNISWFSNLGQQAFMIPGSKTCHVNHGIWLTASSILSKSPLSLATLSDYTRWYKRAACNARWDQTQSGAAWAMLHTATTIHNTKHRRCQAAADHCLKAP